MLERLIHILSRQPLDLDYFQFICTQEMVLCSAFSEKISLPESIMDGLTHLYRLVTQHKSNQVLEVFIEVSYGAAGRPRFQVSQYYLVHLLHQGQINIASLLGVSRRTVYRRMGELNITVRGLYSTLSDSELDNLIAEIKEDMPHAGYWLVKGTLQARGHWVQWERVKASMHRVDTIGILSRLTMCCVPEILCHWTKSTSTHLYKPQTDPVSVCMYTVSVCLSVSIYLSIYLC